MRVTVNRRIIGGIVAGGVVLAAIGTFYIGDLSRNQATQTSPVSYQEDKVQEESNGVLGDEVETTPPPAPTATPTPTPNRTFQANGVTAKPATTAMPTPQATEPQASTVVVLVGKWRLQCWDGAKDETFYQISEEYSDQTIKRFMEDGVTPTTRSCMIQKKMKVG